MEHQNRTLHLSESQIDQLIELVEIKADQFAGAMAHRLTDVCGVQLAQAVEAAQKYGELDELRMDLWRSTHPCRERAWGYRPETVEVNGISVELEVKANG